MQGTVTINLSDYERLQDGYAETERLKRQLDNTERNLMETQGRMTMLMHDYEDIKEKYTALKSKQRKTKKG